MQLQLKIWRQNAPEQPGQFRDYPLSGVSPDMSFLEVLDLLNERLTASGQDPVEFDHDCREGICGSCNLMINGQAHGPQQRTATCQLYMRHFQDGDTVVIEPWRAQAFPIVKDLVVDRSAFDRILAAGGFVSVKTGSAQRPTAFPLPPAMPKQPLTMPPASAVALVLLPAPMRRPLYLQRLR